MIEVTGKPIKIEDAFEIFVEGAGSVFLHYAIIRTEEEGEQTLGEVVDGDGNIHAELKDIYGEVCSKWPVIDLVIRKRIGQLKIGDIASLIAVTAPHRRDALGAYEQIIRELERLKSARKEAVTPG
ncbi:MAG: molybdenum cofactor biosynthesis protein MoaE [Deltaproteobacteria bacterium]|nr:molybdenum cofactor biosynthesis protein MoaE [Deltaproteobacteria bacterium]